MEHFVLIFFGVSALLAATAYFIRNGTGNFVFPVIHWLLLVSLNIHEYYHLGELEERFFRADNLGFIFLSVLSVTSLTTILHSYLYSVSHGDSAKVISKHNTGFIMFVTAIAGVMIATHYGMLWALVEATTLSAAVLIYHDRSKTALEATWKYLFVCSIGITLAFAGILFLGIGIKDSPHGFEFDIDHVKLAAAHMDPRWLKVSFLFVLTGFSVKMGLAPLFNVDIDAKDVSPSPIGAMFASNLLNVGFVAIFRFYEGFAVNAQILPWMNNVLMIAGLLSIFFATIYLLKVQNYKRAFAYSSMDHAGIVVIALASGGIGHFAAILHLVLHSFTKASLFYQIGQVHRIFGSKHEEFLGGYFKINPAGGFVLLIGLVSVLAMPPFGLFVSEFMTFRSLVESNHWAVLITAVFLLSFVLYSMSQKFLTLLFGPTPSEELLGRPLGRVSPWESLTQYVLLGFVLYCGLIQPEFLTTFINAAILEAFGPTVVLK